MKRAFAIALVAVLGVMILGCAKTPTPVVQPPPPRHIASTDELWASDVHKEGDWFIAVATKEVRDSIANAYHEARDLARQNAMKKAVLEVITQEKFWQHQDDIHRRIIAQPQNFIEETIPVENRTFRANTYVGWREKVKVDWHKMKRELQDLGLIRQKFSERKVLVAVYGEKRMSLELIDDLGRKLNEYFNNAGFYAIGWDEVRADIAEERNMDTEATNEFLRRFVEDPEFVSDHTYQGTLTLLRNRGRLLIGFNIIKVAVQGGTVQGGVKAFVKDLLTGRIVADDQSYDDELLGRDTDPDLAVSALLYDISRALAEKLRDKASDWFDREERDIAQRGKGTLFTFVFSGYTSEEITRLSTVIMAALTQGAQQKQLGDTLTVEFESTERVLTLQRKLATILKKNGLQAVDPPIDSAATTVQFRKK